MNHDIPLIFLGLGNVGRALLRQILDTRDTLATRAGLRLVPIGLADTAGLLFNPDGLEDDVLRNALQAKEEGHPLSAIAHSRPLSALDDTLRADAVLVDVTASTGTETILRAALNAGCRVVLANKHPLTGPWEGSRQFIEHPHLRYEATVGAGLPVIATQRYLLDTGDSVTAISGCLSGTLGYLCAELERGVSYSAAVYQARSLGYTEPDPREDLSGRDVARKALILARTAGWPLEMADLTIEALYPESLADISTDSFMATASTLDEEYAARVEKARAEGKTLRYVAQVGPDGGKVGLAAVPQDGPLGALRGPDNYVSFLTHRYAETGLVVSGPGAGPQVTAAGVLDDIIESTSLEPKRRLPIINTNGMKTPTLVMKFGGTSLGSAEAFAQATEIVLAQSEEWDRLVVVVSAMSGVTDKLIKSTQMATTGEEEAYQAIVNDLRAQHHRVVEDLLSPGDGRAQLVAAVDALVDELDAFCYGIHILGEVTPRAMDRVTALGEQLSARILAALLHQRGGRGEAVDATGLILTDDTFRNAAPLMDGTRASVSTRLSPLLDDGLIPVVTGFIGATDEGVATTLGRGGSDYSAAIIGDCLDADEVWLWTDVDGVMTTDPRIVPDAQVLPTLSYNEVGEMAYFGAKVVHPRTIRPVVERDIPLWVKNTFNPTHPGTRICREGAESPSTIKAVTAIDGLSMISVEGRGMMGVPGIAARTFAAVASQGASVLMITQASSEQSISLLIPTEDVPPVIRAIEEEMAMELSRRDVDRVWALDDVVIVTAVGAGMRDTPGVAARVFGALGAAEINVIALAQGSSECSLSLVVYADDAAQAVREIHDQVVLKTKNEENFLSSKVPDTEKGKPS